MIELQPTLDAKDVPTVIHLLMNVIQDFYACLILKRFKIALKLLFVSIFRDVPWKLKVNEKASLLTV